jgi:glycosyltransferase involved in cell wall biosynthesis
VRVLVFHGYLLHGTGSNVYNAELAAALVRLGHEVHLLCQDRAPHELAFVDAVGDWDDGALRVRTLREPVRCTVYRPALAGVLPVYVADRYEGIATRRFPECSVEEVDAYVAANVAAVRDVASRVQPDAALANHLVMGPLVLARGLADTGVPYAVKVHGSALEYVVKPHPRFLPAAREGLASARAVLVGSRHVADSLWATMEDTELPARTLRVPPGVDVTRFAPRGPAAARAGVARLARALAEEGDAPAGGTSAAAAPSASAPSPTDTALSPDASAPSATDTALSPDASAPSPTDTALSPDASAPSATDTALSPDASAPSPTDPAPLPDAPAPAPPDAPSSFARDVRAVAAALACVAAPPDDPLVAFVGKLIVAKGADLLLAAWPLVLMRHPRARLVVVGFGTYRPAFEQLLAALADGDEAALDMLVSQGRAAERGADGAPEATSTGEDDPLVFLRAFLDSLGGEERAAYLAAARDLRDRVVLTGRLQHDELAALLPACEALVVPSTFPEAFGMVAAEAAACGVLPIGAAHSGLVEVAEALAARVPPAARPWLSFALDGDAGAVREIAERVSAWLGAPADLRARTRAAVVETARELWSWEHVAEVVIAAVTGNLPPSAALSPTARA